MDPIAYLNVQLRPSSSSNGRERSLQKCREVLSYAEEDLSSSSCPSLFNSSHSELDVSISDWNYDIDQIFASPASACHRRYSDGMLTMTKRRQSLQKAGRRVSFGQVQVRVHERILGDHIPAAGGPSLSIGWAYNVEKAISMDNYEAKRSSQRRWSSSSSSCALLLSPEKREKIAKKAGFTKKDIEENIKLVSKVQRRRSRTVKELEKEEMAQLIQESRQKCLNRFLQIQSSRGTANNIILPKNGVTATNTNNRLNSLRSI